jgi:uncharacterized membrane protein YfcA
VLLGLVALAGAAFGRNGRQTAALSVDRPAGSAACGLIVTASNLTAGAGGPLLDVFFLASAMERRAMVATKALTQTLSHLLKIAYVGLLSLSSFDDATFSPALLGACLAATLGGTWIGGRVLERLSERRFRGATRVVVGLLGAVYLARGVLA